MKYRPRESYRYEATTLGGFIQKLVQDYISRGYVFYVCGYVGGRHPKTPPTPQDLQAHDASVIKKMNIDLSSDQRYRHKGKGHAKLQYVRYQNFYVILATPGQHDFFSLDYRTGYGPRVKDLRRAPLTFGGYSICVERRYGKNKTVTRIAPTPRQRIHADLLAMAFTWSAERFEREFANLTTYRFEPWAGVLCQIYELLGVVNKARKKQKLTHITGADIRKKRTKFAPFKRPAVAVDSAAIFTQSEPVVASEAIAYDRRVNDGATRRESVGQAAA